MLSKLGNEDAVGTLGKAGKAYMACTDIMRFVATTFRMKEIALDAVNHFTNVGNIMRIVDGAKLFIPLKIEAVRCMRQLVYF